MTRPKVSADNRQRIAHACDSCKRRKQKCNGQKPCHLCSTRKLACHYTPFKNTRGTSSMQRSPQVIKRAHIFKPVDMSKYASAAPRPVLSNFSSRGLPTRPRPESSPNTLRSTCNRQIPPRCIVREVKQVEHVSIPDAGAKMVEARLLQGAMGRLYFIGEPSTLALLQTIRMIVEGTTGPSPFTKDSQRHRLLDSPQPRKTSVTPTAALPNRKEAKMLAHSFFTYGNMELLDARALWQCIDICYQDVLAIAPSDLCMIHLVLSIGSSMGRNPEALKNSYRPDADEVDSVFEPETSFQAAEKMLGDLSDPGQPDVWVIQALALCSVYHLISSRRNAAEECHRRAVSLSFAMGFHKSWEPNIVHSKQETTLRRRIWSSLFILDRFLGASLGHPLAICDEDHPVSRAVTEVRAGEATKRWKPGGILEASHRLGRALIASRPPKNAMPNDLSSDTAQYFYSTDVFIGMPQAGGSPVGIAHALALLHWKLVDDHATILQHRDAFLTLFLQESRKILQTKVMLGAARSDGDIAAPCAIAASRSIRLAKDALDAEILPTRTPFLMYYIFTASLIMLCSDFARLPSPVEAGSGSGQGLKIMRYWAMADRQAERYFSILTQFQLVIANMWRTSETINTPSSSGTDSRSVSRRIEPKVQEKTEDIRESGVSFVRGVGPPKASYQYTGIRQQNIDDESRLPDHDPNLHDSRAPPYHLAQGLSNLVSGISISTGDTDGGWGTIVREGPEPYATDGMDYGAAACLFGLQTPFSGASEAFDSTLGDALPSVDANGMSWPYCLTEPRH